MKGHPVAFGESNQGFQGYLSPCAQGTGPGVIVIQEWWGLVGHIKSVADRFAAEGMSALAPDFYDGRVTKEPDEAGSLMMALDVDRASAMVTNAVSYLLDHPSVVGEKVGVVGFCMGGQLSMFAACLERRIGACVNFYGIHPAVKPDFPSLEAPILGIFAEHDEYACPTSVQDLSSILSSLGKPHEFVTFPGTHHAFFNNDRPTVFDPNAAEAAWAKTLGFLRANLS